MRVSQDPVEGDSRGHLRIIGHLQIESSVSPSWLSTVASPHSGLLARLQHELDLGGTKCRAADCRGHQRRASLRTALWGWTAFFLREVGQVVQRPLNLGILQEITGHARRRRFRYGACIRLFEEERPGS